MNSLHCNGVSLYCTLHQSRIQYIEFTMKFHSSQLIYQKEYTNRQQIIYVLIHHIYDREGWGYQKDIKLVE